MLELYNVLWVIPGVIFIYLYNRSRPNDSISLSGWPYIFLLVFIAILTWLPAEAIVENDFWLSNFSIQFLCIGHKTTTLLIAIAISFILFLISKLKPVERLIFPSAHDNFYKKCIEWENEEILLTLKNEKTYIGILWKYPDNPKSRHESQTISIIPLISGHREKETKKVIWNTHYPEYKDKSDFLNMEVIIPRAEIITFGKFNKETFDHFYKDKSARRSFTSWFSYLL